MSQRNVVPVTQGRFAALIVIVLLSLLSLSAQAKVETYLFSLQAFGEGDLSHFRNYTVAIVVPEHSSGSQNEYSPLSREVLQASQDWYIDIHKQKGNLPEGVAEDMIAAFEHGPESFFDGRSSYIVVIEQPYGEVAILESIKKEQIRSLLRVAKASHDRPLPPFVERLPEASQYVSAEISIQKNQPYRFAHLPSFLSNRRFEQAMNKSSQRPTFNDNSAEDRSVLGWTPYQGDWVELKALAVDPQSQVDFFPIMLKTLEATRLSQYGGHYITRSGHVWRKGDPHQQNEVAQILNDVGQSYFEAIRWPQTSDMARMTARLGDIAQPVAVNRYYLEFDLSPREQAGLEDPKKARGLLAYYLRYGAEVEGAFDNPSIPGNKTVVASFSRENWLDLVVKVKVRRGAPGLKHFRLRPETPNVERATGCQLLFSREADAEDSLKAYPSRAAGAKP